MKNPEAPNVFAAKKRCPHLSSNAFIEYLLQYLLKK